MKKTKEYIANVQKLIDGVLETQMTNIENAGRVVADTIMKDGFVYTFGTGHSHMMAEELFYRAGGLARIYPILEDALMLHNGAIKSTEMERLEGYADLILERYECSEKDCMIITSNSGRNAVNIEMVKAAHNRGMKVIALTNLVHSRAQQSRHKSGLKLYQIGDVILDNQGCLGDASIFIPEIERNIGATSTSIGAMILHTVIISAVENLIEKGHIPEVFSSSNLDEGDEINDKILNKYRPLIKSL